MTGRWGRAGVRLTDAEIAARAREGEFRRAAAAEHEAALLAQEHRKWAAGMVCPHRISMALDRHDLHGPEVDIACGAREPDVDLWEAGRLYPSWWQLQKLALLTRQRPGWFCLPPPVPPRWSSLDIHWPRDPDDPPPVHAFTRAALDDAAPMGVRA